MVILDPGGPPREAQYLVGALGRVIEQRPDLEVFVELRSGASHRLWQMLQKSGLLDTVTVLDHVGALVPLVAKASVVVAPAPQGPARSLIPLSMCGGAAVVAASTACDELLIHNETALVLGPGDADTWAAALGALLSDPPLRQRLARTGRSRATDACREETALAAWITAITSSTESAR
jgi:glycosyltransferase involved in cell wall biosynthesis